ANQLRSARSCRLLADAAVLALGTEELRPGHHLGVLLEQRPPLTFGHPTPNTELDTVVQRVSAALQHDRTVPADDRSLTLCRPPDKQFVGVSGPAQRLGNPRDPRLRLSPKWNGCGRCCCVRATRRGPNT